MIACNLKAIGIDERPHYDDLLKRVRLAMREPREVPDGYAFRLDAKGISLTQTAEWITMERLCCPFLTLQLSASGNEDDWLLTLTGPPGVKALLQTEFLTSSGS